MSEMTIKIERCDMLGNLIPGSAPADAVQRIQEQSGLVYFFRTAAQDIAVFFDERDGGFFRCRRVPA